MRIHLRFRSLLIAALPVAVACASEEPAYVDPVPAKAHAIEGLAEVAFDHALAGDYTALKTDASELDTAWKGYRDSAMKAGLDATSASKLDDSIAQLGVVATAPTSKEAAARAANAVSSTMDEVFAIYEPETPVALHQLDYLGRELWLDGLETDTARASTDLASAEGIWTSLEPIVVAKGGKKEASAFGEAMSALSAAVAQADSAIIVVTAQVELDQVDLIEAVFAKSADAPD